MSWYRQNSWGLPHYVNSGTTLHTKKWTLNVHKKKYAKPNITPSQHTWRFVFFNNPKTWGESHPATPKLWKLQKTEPPTKVPSLENEVRQSVFIQRVGRVGISHPLSSSLPMLILPYTCITFPPQEHHVPYPAISKTMTPHETLTVILYM